MTREIRNKPHPTPHPDGPHAAGSSRSPATGGPDKTAPQADQEFPDDGVFDSCMDDVNLLLTNLPSEPDPALRSKSSELIPRSPADTAPPASQSDARPRHPRTSEIFARVGPAIVERMQGRTGVASKPARPAPNEAGGAEGDAESESETVFEGNAIALGDPAGTPVEPRAAGWASDDDSDHESRFPWPLIILMSYSSAVTLALTWVLIGGRSLQPTTIDAVPPTAAESESEPGSKASIQVRVDSLPPLPGNNVVRLHQTIRLGDLEITPLDISYARLELVRTFEPFDRRHDKAPGLNMRIKFKNVSKKDMFAPLEPRFLRDQLATVDRSLIVPPEGNGIRLYPLAIDSEWGIEGEQFTPISPGETTESIIASETGILGRVRDNMMWRLRVRVGLLRTDVVGVQFDRRDVLER